MHPVPVALLALLGVAVGVHVDLPEPYADHCILANDENKYDPAGQFDVPWFNIDLDKPASERWTEVAAHYSQEIKALIDVVKGLILPIFPDAMQFVDTLFADMNDMMPQPYRDEMINIAEAADVPLGEIVMYNIFYEIFTVCTSIIAQDPRGHLIHARNLDFGLFMGWNGTSHEWEVSSVLRRMVINVNWIKDGKVLYVSNNFAGFIGAYNGLKKGKFSVTANERFMAEGGFVGMIRWALGLEANGKWMTWLTRETLEQAESYEDAKQRLSNTPMLSPVYYILGGVNPWEGCIITRSLNGTDLMTSLDPDQENGWYVLQTNYDQNQDPLFLDDRRTPGNKCMQILGQDNVGFQGVYNVLSSKTNLNKLTAYTVLMDVVEGKFETHLQSCPGSCWPF
uniref:Acid ceramidase n=1 Tax=Steinernema glaseri TaxID=37863 RepID=A0A1I7ZM70_9BILA